MTKFNNPVRCTATAVAAVILAASVAFADKTVSENLTLTQDEDWRDQGPVTISAGVTVDLNGHTLTVKGLSCAGTIIDSSATYQPLDYVQVSGHQKVSTGYLTTDKTAIELDFSNVSSFGNKAIFCGDWDSYGHLLIAGTAKVDNKTVNVFNWFGNNGERIFNGAATNKRYRFVTVPGGSQTVFLYDGETGAQLAANNFSLAHTAGTAPMVLFAGYDPKPEAYWSSYRFHAFKLTDTTTGKVERDYVPVRVLTGDNAGSIGLYDRAYGQFYPNEGSQPFVAGDDVGSPLTLGKLSIDVADGASYAVSGMCNVRVEMLDGSALSVDGDLSCFGENLEVNGRVSLNGHTLTVKGLSGTGGIVNQADYKWLAYIEANGLQRFDTGCLSTDKTAIELDFSNVTVFNNQAIFCGDWAAYGHLLIAGTAKVNNKTVNVFNWFGNGGQRILNGAATNKRYRFVTVPGGSQTVFLYDGETGAQLAANNFSLAHTAGSANMVLFAGWSDTVTTYWSSYRLHAFKMTDTTTGTVVCDYVPAQRNSDGAVGLYDRVTETFRPSGTSTPFGAGAEVRAAPTEMSGSIVLSVPADETVALTARMSGIESLVKTGAGSALVSDTIIADVSQVQINAGVVKVGRTGLVSQASVPGEIHIAASAQLDVNSAQTASFSLPMYETTHGKTIFFAGDGPDSEGAIINTAVEPAEKYGAMFGRLVLTGDASLGTRTGSDLTRMDVKPLSGSAISDARVEGAYTLTVNAANLFDFCNVTFALKELRATGEFYFSTACDGVITNGLRLCTGSRFRCYNLTKMPEMPIVVEPNAVVGLSSESKPCAYMSPVTVEGGATAEANCAQNMSFASGLNLAGALNQVNSASLLIESTLSGNGTLAGAHVRFSGTNSCWRLVADDTGFTNKVDVSGVTDPALLTGLAAIEIVYTGEHPEEKVLEICSVDAREPIALENLVFVVKDGEGNPIPNCWLETADGVLKAHLKGTRLTRTAEWTNAAGDGDLTNPANWICRDDSGDRVTDGLPMSATTLLIGPGCRFVCTNAAPFVCRKVTFTEGASLAADCDWRGLVGIPFEGTLDLAGHKLYVADLAGPATIRSTIDTAFKFYRFKVDATGASYYATTGNAVQIHELKLFSGAERVFPANFSNIFYDSTTFNQSFIQQYNPTKLFDDDLGSGWYDDRADSSKSAAERDKVWVTVECREPILVTEYVWYTSTSVTTFSGRKPIAWRLQGSNDNATWTDLDVVRNEASTTDDKTAFYILNRPAIVPNATYGELHLDVPAGRTVVNSTVSLTGYLKVVKEGEGTFVGSKANQKYLGGTELAAGVAKPGQNASELFGCSGTDFTIAAGAQYLVDIYASRPLQNANLFIAGSGPDGKGAIRTLVRPPSGTNNADNEWARSLTLTGDATINRDDYAFSMLAHHYQGFPLTLNGHVLTFYSDKPTAQQQYPFLLSSSTYSVGTGTLVIGDNLQFYPYSNTNDLSTITLVMTEKSSYNWGADGPTLTVSNLVYQSSSTVAQTARLTTVVGCYAPQSTASAPKVQLGDATHRSTSLDLSDKTDTFDSAFGGGLSFFEGTQVDVLLGARKPTQMEKIIAWGRKPNATFVCSDQPGKFIVADDGLYYYCGLMIIVR